MIKFPCGCTFESNKEGRPIFNPNIYALPLDCPRTWDMICEGNTKGVFQLESQLGQSKAKQVKPRSIEELSDLIAIIRPGCGDIKVDGKSLTQHYIDRKAGKDKVKLDYPALAPILGPTYGILVFQEQAMKIAQLIAGFNLQQADTLRKAIGKKKVDLMAQVKKDFLEGASEVGLVNTKQAEEIFSWIEASQRYSFNKSHSVSYALNGYQTAYAKAHFPRAFFTSYLRHSDGKPKPFIEINELVSNARLMDIDIIPPSIERMKPEFFLYNNKPAFGITNIKNVGKSVYTQMVGYMKKRKIDPTKLTWEQFLMQVGTQIKSNSFESMIEAGVFDYYGLDRQVMLQHFTLYKELDDEYRKYLANNKFKTFIEGLVSLTEYIQNHEKRQAATKVRHIELVEGIIQSIQDPPSKLEDTFSYKAKKEKELLGIELTCSEIDEYDTFEANCTCREYVKGFDAKSISIAAKIEDIREYKTKGGKSAGKVMAFLKISDMSCVLDNVVIFSDDWARLKKEINIDDILLLTGSRDKKMGSFLAKKIKKLKHCI